MPSERGRGGMGVVEEIRRHVGVIKERVLEKVVAASVPADALENARHFLESVVKDVTFAAHGLTKDALTRIKAQLIDILPSLSPTLTTKIVDDAAKEANGGVAESEGEEEGEKGNKESYEYHRGVSSKPSYAQPTSSFFAALKLSSRL